MKRIFSILFALALVLSFSLVAVPVLASPANGDVTIVVQDQAGNPIAGATARLLFYGGGKGGYSMTGKATDGSGSATFTAAEIATWLGTNSYNPSSQIYAQPGAKVETGSAYGNVRTVDPTTGFPCILYNTPGGSLAPKPAMSFTYKMIMMSTQPVQTVWDTPSNNFKVTATLADSVSVTPDVTRMRLIRNLVGGQSPAPGGSDDDWYMWNGTVYERWKGIATVNAIAIGSSVSATFSQGIFSDWLDGNKVVVRAEFGVNRTVNGVPCIDDYSAVDIRRPSSYIGRGLSGSTATGTGTASFGPSAGTLTGFSAVGEGSLPAAAQATLPTNFPDGFFSFTITGLSNGQAVNVTIVLPPGSAPTQYWKYHPNTQGGWVQIPMTIVGPPNVIRITLVDGGLGDDDGTAFGTIVDQGAPGGYPVGWETYPTNKVRVFLPWIALLAAIMAGVSLLVVRRRRRAQS